MGKNNGMNAQTSPTLVTKGDAIDRLFRAAVRNALREHKRAGNSVAVWRDGKVVILKPDEIRKA